MEIAYAARELAKRAVLRANCRFRKKDVEHTDKPNGCLYRVCAVLEPKTPAFCLDFLDNVMVLSWCEGGSKAFEYANPSYPDNLVEYLNRGRVNVFVREEG